MSVAIQVSSPCARSIKLITYEFDCYRGEADDRIT